MNELTKKLMCIVIQGNIELWVEEARLEPLQKLLVSETCPQFFSYEGRLINKNSIVAILNPLDMEEKTRRKNGEWKCNQNNWHIRNQGCECAQYEEEKPFLERMLSCKVCNGEGRIWNEDMGMYGGCECVQ